MPTSYYVDKAPCCWNCGATRDSLKIGESAHGTDFSFSSYPDRNLTTPEQWFAFLEGRRIVTEDGSESDLKWIRDYPIITITNSN
jgi:hypothetical protein